MPRVIVTNRAGTAREIEGGKGESLMEVLKGNGCDEILAICGGSASCATCHVYVDEEFSEQLPAMGPDESDLLSGSPHRKSNSRLSCQIPLSDGLSGIRVTIAPED